jgi:hypothetical protein
MLLTSARELSDDLNMATRIKEEPLDNAEDTPSAPQVNGRKSKKRRREEDKDEGPVRIKKERDLFEVPVDEDSSHTVVNGDGGGEGSENNHHVDDPMDQFDPFNVNSHPEPTIPTSESQDRPSVSEPTPLTNFFQFGSNVTQPTVDHTIVEQVEIKQGIGAPEPKIPKVAHYNAHDEEGEVKYVAEHSATNKKLIDDHRKIVSCIIMPIYIEMICVVLLLDNNFIACKLIS